MRRTLIASLFVAAAAGWLLTRTAFSEGPQAGGVLVRTASAAQSIEAAHRSQERAEHFVEVAKQYAEILPADELEHEIAALERKLNEARAALQLRGIRSELEKVVQEFPDTEAAKAAARMLQQQPKAGTLVPQYEHPNLFRHEDADVFGPSPVKR